MADARPVISRWNPGRTAALTATFTIVAAIMTWPQVLVLKSQAVAHQDVFFNLWRLRWIAHAIAHSPRDLFNGNIFYPEPNVLAFSDAMLVEGVLAAPLFWLGLPPVLVHNLWLLGAIVASSVGIVVLARHLTGNLAASIIAGIVFGFAPYRFEHYMHMELQWTVWVPWAFWALQRTIESSSWRYGLLTGGFVALQMASSVYYGVFVGTLIGTVAVVQLPSVARPRLARTIAALALGGALASSASWLYSLPYKAAASQVGLRSTHDVRMFSARPADYLVATPDNVLYGVPVSGRPERRLSPGIVAPVLALAGLLLVDTTAVFIAYLIGLALAFELSLGAHGVLYPLLYEHVTLFRGLRAPARASVFCLFFLGILAAHAAAALTRHTPTSAGKWALCAVLCLGVLFEYRVAPLALVEYPNDPTPVYKVFRNLPPGIVVEFPMPRPDSPPFNDPKYAYMSTFHWMPLLNGYSGFYPRSYLRRLVRLRDFPDEESVASLRREHARYLIIHEDGYPEGERLRIVDRLLTLGTRRIADFQDGWGIATLMELQ